MSATQSGGDLSAIAKLREAHAALEQELSKVIVGQKDVIDQVLTAIFARGHALLVGVPGLAKTLLVSTLAKALNLSFNRIQFTPDLMPSDITGTEVIQEDKATGQRAFKFIPGPVFGNIILADEINRTPPKTQAALLEAMQEQQVTAGGKRHELPKPFFVLATQNPIEQEGTYPLPEAQLDRFMFMIKVDYPTKEEELRIIQSTTSAVETKLGQVLSGAEIIRLQELVRSIPVGEEVIQYALELTRRTRVTTDEAADFVKEWVAWGAGPRASPFLILGAKACAALAGEKVALVEHVKAVAHPVLRHRIICNFAAAAEGITSDLVIDRLIESVSPVRASSSSLGMKI